MPLAEMDARFYFSFDMKTATLLPANTRKYLKQLMRHTALLLLLNTSTLLAQQPVYHLKGFMGIQGGESFTYRIELQDSAAGWMQGYAYTYAVEKNDVKARIVARIDRAAQTLHLVESEILHNNYFKSKATICLVDASMQYSRSEGSLSGPINTNTMDNGAACARGSISFTNKEEIETLFKGIQKEVEKAPVVVEPKPRKPGKIIVKEQPVPTVAQKIEPAIANITEGKDKAYQWASDTIVMEIWDGNNVDNDRVSVLYNGNEILSNYALMKEPKRLYLAVGGNELNIIAIEANNEGGDPPNTAHIRLYDGDVQHDVVAHNATGKRALIRIRRKAK
jgi:hypothetical protein